MAKFWGRLARRRAGLAGGVFILILTIAALAAGIIFPGDPNRLSQEVMLPPSLEHLMGTDELGRDVLVSIVYGTRVSLTVGFLAAAGASLLGGLIGALAGFYGGLLDLFVMRVSEIFQVVPSFVLAAVIVALSGPGLAPVIFVIILLSWPQAARLMRSDVLRVKQIEFVDAARCLGYGESRILVAEIVPNATAPTLSLATLIVGHAILLEAGLSFFGLTSPDTLSWGRMLNAGQRLLFDAWWLSLFPGMAIFLTVLAFNLLGDAIGDVLNPRIGGAS